MDIYILNLEKELHCLKCNINFESDNFNEYFLKIQELSDKITRYKKNNLRIRKEGN